MTFALTPTFFRAYAVNGNSVVPINLLTRDILSTDIIPLAGHPLGIGATQDGISVFVASLANDISEINTTTNTVARQIDVNGHVTYDIAVTDVGGLRGYAAGGGDVLALDLGDNPQVVATIAIPPPARRDSWRSVWTGSVPT